MVYEPVRAKDLPGVRTHFLSTMNEKGTSILGTMFALDHRQAGLLNKMITMTCEMSDLYFVSSEMTNLATHAGSQLEDNFHIAHEDVPSRYGMVVFESPIGRIERGGFEGTSIPVGAFWSVASRPEGSLVSIYLISDYAHPDAFAFNGNIPQSKSEMLKSGRLGLSGYIQVPMDNKPHDHGDLLGRAAEYPDEEIEKYKDFISKARATIKAAWLLMSQSFVTVTEQSVGRPIREKKGKTKKPPKVKIISLRKHSTKATNNNGDPTPANFDYRFIVKGHWRMQPYGPGRKRVRPVWIAPYIKGPEDKPLRVVDKVYHLKR